MRKNLKKYFKNKTLISLFNTEKKMLEILVPIGWAYRGDYQKPPKKGSQEYVDVLKNYIIENKSTVTTNAYVDELIIKNNSVNEVHLKQQKQELSIKPSFVVNSGDLINLYQNLLPHNKKTHKILSKQREADLYESSVTIFICLKCKADKFGIQDGMCTVFDTRSDFSELNSGNPETNALQIISPSGRTNTRAPEDKGSLVVFISAAYDFENFWHTIGNGRKRGEQYKAFKEEYAQKIFKRMEESGFSGLTQEIEDYSISTPITYERYTLNSNGTIMGARPTMKNIRRGVAHYKTYINNLFNTGHWAEPGGGVPVAVKAGANTAMIILKEMGKINQYKVIKKILEPLLWKALYNS